MADDLNLQIILSAINETGDPFKAMDESIQTFSKAATDLAKSIDDAFKTIVSAITTATSSIEGSMKSDSAALVDFGKSATDQTKVVEDSLSGVSKSAEDVAKSMSTAAADIDKDMQTAAKAVGEFEKTAETDLAGASQSMNGLRDNMNKGIGEIGGLIAIQMLGQSMEELGKKGEKLFDFAITQGSDFQQTMKNIQVVIATNNTSHESWNDKMRDAVGLTDQLQQKALDLGSRGAQSANEVAAGMDTMIRSGVDGKAVLNGAIESAQNVAIVTGDKLEESANIVTEVYHNFRSMFAENGKSVQENMKETGDVMTGTLLSARISSTDLIDTMKYVGPVASEMGSSFLDVSTASALLAQNGIKNSQAGTSLRHAYTSLIAPTKGAAAALEALGVIQNGHNKLIDEATGKVKSLTDIQKIMHDATVGLTQAQELQASKAIFGQQAMTGGLVFMKDTANAYDDLKNKIAGVNAEQASTSMLDTFSGAMGKLEAHMQTTAKEFGLSFIPVLEKLIPIGQEILDWFQGLTPQTKELGMGLLAAGSAIAIIGGALATFAISAKFAGEGMKALQGLFMVQAEGEAAITVFKSFGLAVKEVGLAEAFMDLMSPMAWIALAVAAVVGLAFVITEHWGPIKEFISNLWTTVSTFTVNIFNDVIAFFKKWGLDIVAVLLGPVGIIAKLIYDHWDAIKKFTVQLWNDITGGITSAWTSFTTFITDAVQKTMAAIIGSFSWLYDHNYYIKAMVDDIVKLWSVLKKATEDAWNGIIKFLTDLWNGISKVATDVWNAIKLFFETVWGAITKTATELWKPIGEFFSTLWDGIDKAVTKVWNGIKTFLNSLWNGIISDAKGIFNSLGSYFADLGNQAYQWGANLVNMIANGIKNAAHAVADAAKSVVSSVAGFLGFHSPAKEGPGKDADTWMPNLFKMMTDQIHQSIPNMQAALQVAFNPSMTGVTNMGAVTNMSPVMPSGNGAPIYNITVQASGNVTESNEKLGDIVSKALLDKMKQQGKIG